MFIILWISLKKNIEGKKKKIKEYEQIFKRIRNILNYRI